MFQIIRSLVRFLALLPHQVSNFIKWGVSWVVGVETSHRENFTEPLIKCRWHVFLSIIVELSWHSVYIDACKKDMLAKIYACKNNTCWQKTCWHAGHQRRFIGHRRWLPEIRSQKSMDFQDIPPLCSSYCSFFPWWSRWDPLRIIIWFLPPTDIFTEIIIFWISLSISTKLSGSVLPVQLPHWLHHVLREDTKGPGNHHHHLLKWPRHHWSSSPPSPWPP